MSQELLSKVTSRKLREALSDYFSTDRATKERGAFQLLGLSGFNPWDAQLLQVYGVLPSMVGPDEKLPDLA